MPAHESTTPRFEDDAEQILRALRDAFAEVIETATGQLPRPAELCRILSIDKKLGWKISKVIQSRDLFAIVEHIPGSGGVDIFLDAAGRAGATAEVVRRARDANRDFERLIDVHAGDRASLEMMARGFSRGGSDQTELAHRRDAFRGNSYTWGVQARTQLSTNIIFPAREKDRVDIALVSGLIDLRRLRPNVTWVVARLGFVAGTGQAHGANAQAPAVPLLKEFCSDSLPGLRAVASPAGFLEIELEEGPVGDTGAMTCIFSGDVFRNAGSVRRTPEDPVANLNVHVRTPSNVLVHDLIVHASLFGRLNPTASVYSEVHREVRSAAQRDERYRLPVRLPVDYLGFGASVLRTPDVPRYPELARHVMGTHGENLEDFDVYRLRMRYPIVPTAVTMSFELPDLA